MQKKWFGILLLFTVITSVSGYAADAIKFPRLTPEQVERLADKIMDNTPERLHFDKRSHFDWVLLSPDFQYNTADLRKAMVDRLKQKYIIYTDSNLPEALVIRDDQGALIGYKGGFLFSFSARLMMDGKVMVQYSDWEGNLAASSHWERYEWNGADWKVIEKSPTVVS